MVSIEGINQLQKKKKKCQQTLQKLKEYIILGKTFCQKMFIILKFTHA